MFELDFQTKNLTILLTDIKEYTSTTSRYSRKQINQLIAIQDTIIRPIITRFGGGIIKTIGDAYLATFESPTNAVLCGMALQKALEEHNAKAKDDERFEIRVAINSGEVNIKDGDIFGKPVNITARIEGITEAGEVQFTEAVYLSMNVSEIPSAEVGWTHLKGIPEEIKIYRVLPEHEDSKLRGGDGANQEEGRQKKIKRFIKRALFSWLPLFSD